MVQRCLDCGGASAGDIIGKMLKRTIVGVAPTGTWERQEQIAIPTSHSHTM